MMDVLAGWPWGQVPSADEWQAYAAWATVAVAVVAAIVALAQHQQSVRTRLEQSRPYVNVDFEFLSGAVAVISVKNTGLTAARDIRLTWSVPLIADDDAAQRAINRALVDGISFLSPGRSMRYFYRSINDDWPEDVARLYRVDAQYRGSGDRRKWSSESVLDLDQWVEVLVEESPLEILALETKKIAEALGPMKSAAPKIELAADSINVNLEAKKRVIKVRERRRDLMYRRLALQKKREADRQAMLAAEAALSDEEESDGNQ